MENSKARQTLRMDKTYNLLKVVVSFNGMMGI